MRRVRESITREWKGFGGEIISGNTLKEEDLVFTQEDGKPLLPDTVSHAWVKLARLTGLKGIRLHDARHSHASSMLKQGVHPKIVQETLGHASIKLLLLLIAM
jgi:integrase